MLTYETIFVAPADQPAPKLDEFIDRLKEIITRNSGEIVLLDKWGRRRLAYPIRRHREGFYVFISFKAPSKALAEINRLYQVSEDIIRQLVVKAPRPSPIRIDTRTGQPAIETAGTAAAPLGRGFGAEQGPQTLAAGPVTAAIPKETPSAQPTSTAPAQ